MITLVLSVAMFAADPAPVKAPVQKTKAYWAQLRRERAQRSLGKKRAARDEKRERALERDRQALLPGPGAMTSPPLIVPISPYHPGGQRSADGRPWTGNFWWPYGGYRPIATYD